MLKNPFILFGFALVLFLAFLPSYQKMQDLAQKNMDYQQQIYELVDENRRLEEEKRLLKDDPDYLEKVAREKMGLIREGEVIYKIDQVEAPVVNGPQ
ncbi:MAG TPA: septum formation initiator family protein [Candidatus Bathyarchaeia archaeon]|nr:septum formation initiator family protein [Candidatus Bathyarchaeia archaeon]